MSEYGIHSGGAQVDSECKFSVHASCKSNQDFQAKNAQKTKLAPSTTICRVRFTPGGNRPTIASMATCPRRAWIAADDMNTAPTMRNTDNSSCQSVEKCRK